MRAARRAPTASTTVTVPSSRKSRAASRVAARISSLPARPTRHHLYRRVCGRDLLDVRRLGLRLLDLLHRLGASLVDVEGELDVVVVDPDTIVRLQVSPGAAARPRSRARAGWHDAAAERRTPGRSRPRPGARRPRPKSRPRYVAREGVPAARSSISRRGICLSCSIVSAWKTMISSIRLMNSGRKLCRSTSIVSSFSSNEPLSFRAKAWMITEVRGHDQDRVLEVDRAALRVGEPTVVQDLEQDVEDVCVRSIRRTGAPRWPCD